MIKITALDDLEKVPSVLRRYISDIFTALTEEYNVNSIEDFGNLVIIEDKAASFLA